MLYANHHLSYDLCSDFDNQNALKNTFQATTFKDEAKFEDVLRTSTEI